MKNVLMTLALTFFACASFAGPNWTCSNSKGTESLSVEIPNGATFRIVNDLKNGKFYSAETEEVASDRVDYKTIDFVLEVQTAGISPDSCPNGLPAKLNRSGKKYAKTLCCEKEVEISLPDSREEIQ